MNQRQLELALKKQTLLLECASQRQQFAQHAAGLQPLFNGADRTVDAALWLKQHPLVIAAGSAAFFMLRPRVLWRWGTKGYSLWRLTKTLRGRI
jgi:hypothetical protein